MTKDGLRQMSDAWINSSIGKGKTTRLELAVGVPEAALIDAANKAGQVEKWLMHSDAFGHLGMVLLDSEAQFLSPAQQVSKIEPHRVLRRLQYLREWSHGKEKANI